MTITLDTPVTDFPGVGPARAKKLEKLGILRAADLLTYYPRDYEDRRRIWSIWAAPLGEKVCVSALAAERPCPLLHPQGDGAGEAEGGRQLRHPLPHLLQPVLSEKFLPAWGGVCVLWGDPGAGLPPLYGQPVFEREGDRDFTGRIVPVYPLTAGISNHLMVSLIRRQ